MKLFYERDKILREKCVPFDFKKATVDPSELSQNMIDLMTEHSGVGLSAPQCGFNYRIFVMGSPTEKFVCYNPEILDSSYEEVDMLEGCLSFPGLFMHIKRPAEVKVQWQNELGEREVENLNGLWARCFQHELDHLNGVLFTDHVSRLKLGMARKKQQKILERGR